MANYGFGALQQNISTGNNFSKYNLHPDITVGRVVEVILNPNSATEVGYIKYVDVTTTPNDVSNLNASSNYLTAQPLNSNNLRIPLINELVLITNQPNIDSRTSLGSTTNYYTDILNLYNHPHHNALPQFEGNSSPSQVKSLNQIELGNTIKSPNKPTTITLGKTFVERPNINPLLPFEGDNIYQGRFGQSIRFGSTVCSTYDQTTRTPVNQTYIETYNFTSGDSNIPSTFNSKLLTLNNQVTAFKVKYPDYSISITLIGSESQVPNPNNLPSGELSKIRVNNLLNLVKTYPLLKDNITTSTRIGTNTFIASTDNPKDEKYTKEQYVTIRVSLQAIEIKTKTISTDQLNNWSEAGTNGDPITIIRNGQGSLNDNGSQVITEDINHDSSSIYLTSTQQIPIIAGSSNYYSYDSGSAPQLPEEYAGNQIIINSGRLLFNSSTDHLLLSSAKSISLSAINSVNVDTNNFIVQSNKLYLGSKTATEPLLLGNSTVNLLNDLLTNLSGLMQVLSVAVSTPPGTPLAQINFAASQMLNSITKIQSNLENIKSKDNFTI